MMSQWLGAYQYQDPSAGIGLMIHPDHDAGSSDWMYDLASSLHCTTTDINSCEPTDPNMMRTMESSSESMEIWHTEMRMVASTLPVDPDNQLFEDYCTYPRASIGIAELTPLAKRKVVESGIDNGDRIPTDTPREKKIQTSAKNARSKKAKSMASEEKEESNGSYSSGENSNTSQEPNGGDGDGNGKSCNAKGKTRASRGSAAGPQSLYARKRRERINERLRTLQNLVPNGTKVDLSTMLEEAVQYVKFLQLQIKLLSSDDMWMYAPLAYNGMDIGLDLKLPFPQQRH